MEKETKKFYVSNVNSSNTMTVFAERFEMLTFFTTFYVGFKIVAQFQTSQISGVIEDGFGETFS